MILCLKVKITPNILAIGFSDEKKALLHAMKVTKMSNISTLDTRACLFCTRVVIINVPAKNDY